MIPVLICPVLRSDLVGRMLASVDVLVERYIIVDNGGHVDRSDNAIRLPANLGVAASWNLGIKLTIGAPWWFVTNDDIEYTTGDLASLVEAMEEHPLVTLDGFASFGIRRDVVQRVGLFDENFHPAYCEDADYEYRCKLAGIPITELRTNLRHVRSSTISLPQYRDENTRTYPENRAYYRAKWGGDIRGGETFDSPFDGGGDVDEWTLSPGRLASLAWRVPELVA